MISALLSVILPTFGVIAIGIFARHIGIWKDNAVEVLNKYAYYIALPALIFLNVVSMQTSELLNSQTLIIIGLTVAIHFVIIIVTLLIEKIYKVNRETRAASPMLMTFGSTAYMGIPFVTYLVGGKATAIASLLSVALVVVMIIVHTMILNKLDRLPSTQNNFISFLELPFIWAVVLALGWLFLKFPPLPMPIIRFLETLAGSAGPTALLGIGSFLHCIKPSKVPWTKSIFYSLIKVIVLPLTIFVTMNALGLEKTFTVIAVALSAVGTGVTCFVMAEEHKIGTKETAGAILVSTFLSLISLTLISLYYFST